MKNYINVVDLESSWKVAIIQQLKGLMNIADDIVHKHKIDNNYYVLRQCRKYNDFKAQIFCCCCRMFLGVI